MCATKRECKWRGKKILRKSVTKTEKSRYRDEFLIRYSKDVYVLNRFFLPKNSSKLSCLFVAIVFLIFIFLLRKSRIKNSIIYSILLFFLSFLNLIAKNARYKKSIYQDLYKVAFKVIQERLHSSPISTFQWAISRADVLNIPLATTLPCRFLSRMSRRERISLMKESSGRNRVEDRKDRIEMERKRKATWKIIIFSIYGRADRRYFHSVSFTFVVFCVFVNPYRNNSKLRWNIYSTIRKCHITCYNRGY